MSEKKRQVLNLDDLMGQSCPIVVTLGGMEYELRPMEAFGPVEAQKFQTIQRLYNGVLHGIGAGAEEYAKGHTAEEAEKHEADWFVSANTMITKLLALLNPELAEMGLTWAAMMKVLTFYQEQSIAQAPEKKAEAPQTGAPSTAS